MANIPTRQIIAGMLLLVALTSGLIAGVMAQADGELFVTITQVDSRVFPQVTADVAVVDGNGVPLTGLTEADFTVFEDELEALGTLSAVESNDSLALSLALVLDVSMPDAELAEVKEAAIALLDGLGPQDRIALLVLYDKIELRHNFTDNTGELLETIKNLEAKGNYTALYEISIEAAAVTNEFPTGRKAVIVLTNFRDNISTRSAESVVDYTRSVGVPLYTIGFGPEFKADPFREMVKLTGGQSIYVTSPDEVRDAVQGLEKRLRQGYRLTFQSGLKADNVEHDFRIDVSHEGATGRAVGRLLALPGQVMITAPGVADEPVAGIVSLTTEAAGPAPIVSVQYWLDGQLLDELSSPPFRLDWDSATVEAGSHTLVVKAVDNAGNETQTEIPLEVAAAPVVQISIDQEEVMLGEEVTIEASVEASTQVSRVEFFLDGKSVTSDDNPPYTWHASFDPDTYAQGEHTITVQVKDSLGQKGEANHTIHFLAPSPEQPGWLSMPVRVAAASVAIWALILATYLILRCFFRAQRRRYQRKYYLEIDNLGNVHCSCELRVEEPAGGLKFQLGVNGIPLPEQEKAEGEGVAVPAALPAREERAETVESVEQQAGKTPVQAGKGDEERTPEKLGQAQRSAKGVFNMGTAAAGVLGLLGNLLPGSLGAPFRNTARSLRKGQQKASRVARAPAQKITSAKRLPAEVRRLKPGSSSPARRAGSHGARGGTLPSGTGKRSVIRATSKVTASRSASVDRSEKDVSEAADTFMPGESRGMSTPSPSGAGAEPAYQALRDDVHRWTQTPPLNPGESLILDLLIDPVKPYRTQEYSFTIISRLVDLELAPAARQPLEPVTETSTVQIVGASGMGRFLSIMMAVGVVILVGLFAGSLILWLLRF